MQHVMLDELPTDHCWALLRTATVGRISWTTSHGPEVVPVNIAVDDHTVYIRTHMLSAMVQRVDAERVAIQADRIDEATHTGWTVRARGRAEVRYAASGDGPDPSPWPEGAKSATVVVAVDEIDGRRLVEAGPEYADQEEESR